VIDIGFTTPGGSIARKVSRMVGLRVRRVPKGVALQPITSRFRLSAGIIVMPPEPPALRRLARELSRLADEIETEKLP
jgi:hypothetical protein